MVLVGGPVDGPNKQKGKPVKKIKAGTGKGSHTDKATRDIRSGKFLLTGNIQGGIAANYGKLARICMNSGDSHRRDAFSRGRGSNTTADLQKAKEQFNEAAMWFGTQRKELHGLGDANGSAQAEKNRLAAVKNAEEVEAMLNEILNKRKPFRLSDHPPDSSNTNE